MQDPSSQSTSARETEGRSARRRWRHTVRPRREELVQLPHPRQDEGERGDEDGGDADGGEAAGDREERWSVDLSLVCHADPAKKSAESAAM
eukprot:4997425-Prymnesium_polylepis.1